MDFAEIGASCEQLEVQPYVGLVPEMDGAVSIKTDGEPKHIGSDDPKLRTALGHKNLALAADQ